MSLSGKDRQNNWRTKQKALGKKPYTVMLSRKAQAILEDEKKRTRESLSIIIEKAILYLGKSISGNKENVTGNNDDYMKDIINNIVSMKDVDRLTFIEIAEKLTSAGIKTNEGVSEWDRRQVYMLYNQAQTQIQAQVQE